MTSLSQTKIGKSILANALIQHSLQILFYSILSAIMTWPLVLDLQNTIIGQTGDNLFYVWLIGWYQKAIFELGINPLFVPFHHYPFGWSLAYTEITLSTTLPGLPFSLIGGPILGYNIAILLSFILSGWIVSVWVKSITGNWWAGLLAGSFFAFSPYRMIHVYGHLPLMGTHWLALHYFGLFMLLRESTFKWRYVLAAGIGFGLSALSSMYYLYMTGIVSASFIAVFIVLWGLKHIISKKFWLKLLAVSLTALPFVILALLPYLQLAQQNKANHRDIFEADRFSASFTDFFLPSPAHDFWVSKFSTLLDRPFYVEQYLYLGILPIGLVILMFLMTLSKRQPFEIKRDLIWLIVPAVLAGVLSLGITLHWMGNPVILQPVPELLKQFYVTSHGNIPMPNWILFRFLPFYNGMRAFARYGIYTMMFISVIAGIGIAVLRARIRNRYVYGALILLTLVFSMFDVRTPTPTVKVNTRAVDLWLAQQPYKGSVIQFPLEDSYFTEYIYASLIHNKPLFGVFYGAYLPDQFLEDINQIGDFPNKDALLLLNERGVDYILIDVEKMQDWPEKHLLAEQMGLRLANKIAPYWIYILE